MKKFVIFLSLVIMFGCGEDVEPETEFATAIINGEEFTSSGGDGLHLIPGGFNNKYLVFLIIVANGEREVGFNVGVLAEANIFERRVYDSHNLLIWSQSQDTTIYRNEIIGNAGANWIEGYNSPINGENGRFILEITKIYEDNSVSGTLEGFVDIKDWHTDAILDRLNFSCQFERIEREGQ